jgi:hypothetical protein
MRQRPTIWRNLPRTTSWSRISQLKLPSPHIRAPAVSREISTISSYMDDIHAPTVSSGPTSSGYSNGIPKEQLSLQELISEKDRVETELKALGQVLDSVRMQVSYMR